MTHATPANHPFEPAAFLFSTFLYAAAVHLIIHHSYRAGGSPPEAAIMVVLLIGFVFSDWSSRTRLPSLTGDRITAPLLLVKTFLEIFGVYFLVSSFLLLVAHEAPGRAVAAGALGPYSTFGVFLVVTWLWDLFMLGVMKGLRWVDLFWAIVRGDARSEKALAYLTQLKMWEEGRPREIEKKRVAIDEALDHKKFMRAAGHLLHLRVISFAGPFLNANLAVALQLLTNHMAHANLVAGVVIVLREAGWWHLEWPALSKVITWWWGFGLLVPFFITVVFLAMLVGAPVGRAWSLGSAVALAALGGLTYLNQRGVFGAPFAFPGNAWHATALLAAVWMVWSLLFYAKPVPGEKKHRANKEHLTYLIQRAVRPIGGVLILLTLLLVYLLLPARGLMILLALQQVFANIFLQLWLLPPAASGSAPAESTEGDAMCMV
ncbi:MAG: hypothetical protein ABIT01_09995 [Thermoanaerobaculia bacterium]